MTDVPITEWNAIKADVDQARRYLYEGRPVAAFVEIRSALDRIENVESEVDA